MLTEIHWIQNVISVQIEYRVFICIISAYYVEYNVIINELLSPMQAELYLSWILFNRMSNIHEVTWSNQSLNA